MPRPFTPPKAGGRGPEEMGGREALRRRPGHGGGGMVVPEMGRGGGDTHRPGWVESQKPGWAFMGAAGAGRRGRSEGCTVAGQQGLTRFITVNLAAISGLVNKGQSRKHLSNSPACPAGGHDQTAGAAAVRTGDLDADPVSRVSDTQPCARTARELGPRAGALFSLHILLLPLGFIPQITSPRKNYPALKEMKGKKSQSPGEGPQLGHKRKREVVGPLLEPSHCSRPRVRAPPSTPRL